MHNLANDIENKLKINHNESKIFVFDLDGTIIYDGMRMESRFEEVLKKIIAHGHQVYYATGRSERDYIPMVPEWSLDLPAVVFGGGMVLQDMVIQHKITMNAHEIQPFIQYLHDHHVSYLIDGENDYYHHGEIDWIVDDILRISGQKPATNLDNILETGTFKILVLDYTHFEQSKQFARQHNFELKFHSYHKCFDIMPNGVNKYVGLQYLPLCSDENIFIFGNDHNDLELMQNYSNTIMFGDYHELLPHAKIQIHYNDALFDNFNAVVDTILKMN